MDDWVTTVTDLLRGHPAVRSVEFTGARSRGTHEELSDWDFAVDTSDFAALARDLPALVAPLKPLSQQWEPMGHFPVYQVLLPGLTKIEYLFLDLEQVEVFVARRDALEDELGVTVDRRLEDEVRPGIERALGGA
jgi:hypothetical protein